MAEEREPPKVTALPLGEDARSRLKAQRKRKLAGVRPAWAGKLGAVAASSQAGVLGIPRGLYLGASLAFAIEAWRHEDADNQFELLAAAVLLLLGNL
jgi:hypothetical protein